MRKADYFVGKHRCNRGAQEGDYIDSEAKKNYSGCVFFHGEDNDYAAR